MPADPTPSLTGASAHDHFYLFEAFDAAGNRKWVEGFWNALTDEGLNDILSRYYTGSDYTASHYVGLINNTPTPTLANADTMASHAGWAELTAYAAAERPAVTWGAVAAQSVSNAAAKASFSIDDAVSIYGAFLTTSDAKGGTTGTLVGHGAFSAVRSLASGDTLQVTVTATAARA